MNDLECRYVKQVDYEKLCSWWQAHDWAGVPMALLPPIGVIAYGIDDGKEYAAGWLYVFNDCPGGMIEWLVANPENSARESYRGIVKVIDCLEFLAKDAGIKVLFSAAKNEALGRILCKHEFDQTDTNVNHYIKGLK